MMTPPVPPRLSHSSPLARVHLEIWLPSLPIASWNKKRMRVPRTAMFPPRPSPFEIMLNCRPRRSLVSHRPLQVLVNPGPPGPIVLIKIAGSPLAVIVLEPGPPHVVARARGVGTAHAWSRTYFISSLWIGSAAFCVRKPTRLESSPHLFNVRVITKLAFTLLCSEVLAR